MFAPYAVYTILHRDRLDAIAKSGKTAQLNETKRWVTGRALHIEAQKQGEDMVILYGDASHCSDLLYWGRLTEIQVDANGTRYTVADLSALSLKKTQELVLQSTNSGNGLRLLEIGILRMSSKTEAISVGTLHTTVAFWLRV